MLQDTMYIHSHSHACQRLSVGMLHHLLSCGATEQSRHNGFHGVDIRAACLIPKPTILNEGAPILVKSWS